MARTPAVCSLLAALLLLVPNSGVLAQPTPDQCFNPTNNTALADAVYCLSRTKSGRQFVLDSSYITPATAPNYFPTISSPYPAWTDFQIMVTNMLTAQRDGLVSPPAVPAGLLDWYSMTSFTDVPSGRKYWVAVEKQADANGRNLKGYGTIIVDQARCCRPIQLAAPHTKDDLYTDRQAAQIMVNTNACTLVVAGAARDAYNISSICQGAEYNPPDVAHDLSLPFHKITRTIWSWEKSNFGCAAGSCGHIQLHGMSADTCGSTEVFLSAGTGTTTWYGSTKAALINNLRSNLLVQFAADALTSSFRVNTPKTDTVCSLRATTNIFNRWVHGTSAAPAEAPGDTGAAECGSSSPSSSAISGLFIHAEQDPAVRAFSASNPASFNTIQARWAAALNATFGLPTARCTP